MAIRKLISFDWAIKHILRNKANFDILEGFLTELLKDDIKILEILESESNKIRKTAKLNRVDLKVKSDKHGIIIIEVQYEYEIDFFSRILWSSSKAIVEHLDESKAYGEVPKVISISILYADIGKGNDYIYRGTTAFKGIHNHKTLQLEEREKEYYELNRVFNVFPEHYLIKLSQFNKITQDTLDEWIYFLKTASIKDNFTAKGIQKAQQSLNILQLKPQERQAYDNYQEDLHYQASMLESSYGVGIRKGRTEGRVEGKIEGKIELILALLDAKFSTTFNKHYQLQLEKMTLEELHLLPKKILHCDTIEQLFG